MNEDRFAGLLSNRRRLASIQPGQENLRGFMVNPFAGSVTPAQAAIYQAAFQQAQLDVQEPEWPEAECWN